MKKHICALLCALLLLGGTVPAASALEGESLRAADTLAALGIVRGDYALDTPATYTHAAVLLVRLALRKAPKKWSYLLWLVVAFRLCCPVQRSPNSRRLPRRRASARLSSWQ